MSSELADDPMSPEERATWKTNWEMHVAERTARFDGIDLFIGLNSETVTIGSNRGWVKSDTWVDVESHNLRDGGSR